jgi:RNA polymerase-binding protein DksA
MGLIMAQETSSHRVDRNGQLRQMLDRIRDEAYERIRELRRDQAQEAEPPPADEMDVARATADVETHASLVARQEEKIRFIDEALSRLDSGTYGVCMGCRLPISFDRLNALPFAAYCVDCQEQRNHARREWGEGTMIPPYDQLWTVPEEMEEAPARDYRSTGPEEDLVVRFGGPSGPEKPAKPTSPRKKRKPVRR